jgi:hypothetical protein
VTGLERIAKKLDALCLTLEGAREIPSYSPESHRMWGAGRGSSKLFAWISFEAKSEGIHFRSNDPRFEKSGFYYGKKPSNVVRYPWKGAEPDWAELKTLLAESLRLTLSKNMGVAPKYEFAELNPLLGRALETAKPEHRPAGPYHAGGPAVKIPARDSLAAAVWCAESVADLVADGEKKTFETGVRLAKRMIDAPPPRTARTGHGETIDPPGGSPEAMLNELHEVAESSKKDSRALGAARRAAGAAASLCRGKSDMVWSNAMLAAERAVQALEEAGEVDRLRTLLAALDDRILAAEARAQALEKGKLEKAPEIARVLWRGGAASGAANAWLFRLVDGSYALLAKQGARFAWTPGSRDDLLATVPDAVFASATKVALTRDSKR